MENKPDHDDVLAMAVRLAGTGGNAKKIAPELESSIRSLLDAYYVSDEAGRKVKFDVLDDDYDAARVLFLDECARVLVLYAAFVEAAGVDLNVAIKNYVLSHKAGSVPDMPMDLGREQDDDACFFHAAPAKPDAVKRVVAKPSAAKPSAAKPSAAKPNAVKRSAAIDKKALLAALKSMPSHMKWQRRAALLYSSFPQFFDTDDPALIRDTLVSIDILPPDNGFFVRRIALKHVCGNNKSWARRARIFHRDFPDIFQSDDVMKVKEVFASAGCLPRQSGYAPAKDDVLAALRSLPHKINSVDRAHFLHSRFPFIFPTASPSKVSAIIKSHA